MNNKEEQYPDRTPTAEMTIALKSGRHVKISDAKDGSIYSLLYKAMNHTQQSMFRYLTAVEEMERRGLSLPEIVEGRTPLEVMTTCALLGWNEFNRCSSEEE